MNQLSLKLSGISKTLAGKALFTDLSCEFPLGCTAIVGPNGIGKTTLLSILVGAMPHDAGCITVNGINLASKPVKAKTQLGYLPDVTMVYPFITGSEFIHFICSVKKAKLIHAAEQLMVQFGLEKYMDTQFSEMSLGTQKKFMIIAALIGDPAILILDEPTNALEQTARDIFIDYLNAQEKTKIIVFSTHDQHAISQLKAKKLIFGANPVVGLQDIL